MKHEEFNPVLFEEAYDALLERFSEYEEGCPKRRSAASDAQKKAKQERAAKAKASKAAKKANKKKTVKKTVKKAAKKAVKKTAAKTAISRPRKGRTGHAPSVNMNTPIEAATKLKVSTSTFTPRSESEQSGLINRRKSRPSGAV